MKNKALDAKATASLRKQAEARIEALNEQIGPQFEESVSPEQRALLLHELQVHQVELEIQNEELRATQTLLNLTRYEYIDLYEHAPVGYCTVSPEGILLKANKTFASLIVEENKPLEGQNLARFLTTEDQDKFYLFLRTLQKTRTAASIILQMRVGTRDSFCSRLDARFVDVPTGGSVIRVVVSDITREKLAEQALEVNVRLESLDALAGGIAHDFNNLLGGILGYITLAKEASYDSKRVLRYLEKAESVFGRARSLTLQLLAFSKRNAPQTKVMALRPLVEKCASFILSGSETQFQVTSGEPLWPAALDEDLIGQLVDNLVLNASQSMSQRGLVQISIHNITLSDAMVASLPAGSYLELTIADTGTGIPKALMSKIFDPFFTTKTTGHGLGLATAQSIVRKHGGVLFVDSVEGQGTTFHVVLPALPSGISLETDQAIVGHKGNGTILLMDDEPFNLEILSEMFGFLGYETLKAKDGEEALVMSVSQTNLKAAFLDLTVKGGNGGKDTVGPLLKMHPGLPVFAISGYCEDPIMSSPKTFGFTDSLQKPIRSVDLGALLAKHLDPP